MEQSKLTVVNLRGTSGCGKTTIVRNILNKGQFQKNHINNIPVYVDLVSKWSVVGSYENECGGCDTIKHQTEVEYTVEQLLEQGYNVVFEGLLISTISQRWIDFSRRISNKANTLFMYLDTPVEDCVQRVILRRQVKGNNKPFNTKNTVERVKAIDTTYQKLSAAGCYCIKESQQQIIQHLHDWFDIGG